MPLLRMGLSGVNGSRFCKWSQDHLKTVRNSVLSVLSVTGFDMDFLKQISKCPEAPSPDWGGSIFLSIYFTFQTILSRKFLKKFFEKFFKFFGRQTLFCIIKRPAKIQTFKNRLEPNSDWKDQGPFELEIQSGPSKLEGPLTPLALD